MSKLFSVCGLLIALTPLSTSDAGGTRAAKAPPISQVCLFVPTAVATLGFEAPTWEGRLLTARELPGVGVTATEFPTGSQFFLIGTGGGAYVVRVKPPGNKESEVIKAYRRIYDNEPAGRSQERYARDKKYLPLMRKAVEKRKPGETFAVVPLLEANDATTTTRLGDVQGHDFDRVLEAVRGTPQYDRLIADFNRKLDIYAADLKAAGMTIVKGPQDPVHEKLNTYRAKIPEEEGILDIGTPANFIYDPRTGQLTLIDPF